MDYFIGIDSGGTKTEAILADETGCIIARNIDQGCNPMDIGVVAAREKISAVIENLVEKSPGKVKSMYAGIAGVNRIDLDMEEEIKKKFCLENAKIEDDRKIVLSGNIGRVNGCGLICGTGSSLSIVKDGEPTKQIGGLGYLIDTCGSGFELGQAALKQAFRYLDGRGDRTILPELIEKYTGKNIWDSLEDIYLGGRSYIAGLSRCVFEGMAVNDKVSVDIAAKAASALAELVNVAANYFDGVYPVVMTGGIINSHPEYVDMICARVNQRAKMIKASFPPVYGAIVEAMWQCGKSADTTSNNFTRDYNCICLSTKKVPQHIQEECNE